MKRIPRHLPPTSVDEQAAYAIIRRLRQHGFEAYTVGGAVRDRLLARHPGDADVATQATPDQVMAIFPHTIAVGAAFGVVVVVSDTVQTEVATFRAEHGYADGRHPDQVEFCDARRDAERRDFTVNALFYDPAAGEILDFVGGLDDLHAGVIRAIGCPHERFGEDHLRMLRAVRFAAELGFEWDLNTAAAVKQHAAEIDAVSAERIYAEFSKMLLGRRPARAFQDLLELGLLAVLLPEVAALAGVEQPPQFHPEGDVWEHTLLMLAAMPDPSLELAWSVLLHDVGKPPTRTVDADGTPRFPNHAAAGRRLAGEILTRLRAPRRVIDAVRTMIRWHMSFADVPRMRPATLRRMLARSTFADELELHRIDCLASHGRFANYVFLLDQMAAYADEPVLPEPLLSGNDVLEVGVAPGPEIGRILKQAQDLQLNGDLHDRDQALQWLAEYVAQIGEAGPDE